VAPSLYASEYPGSKISLLNDAIRGAEHS